MSGWFSRRGLEITSVFFSVSSSPEQHPLLKKMLRSLRCVQCAPTSRASKPSLRDLMETNMVESQHMLCGIRFLVKQFFIGDFTNIYCFFPGEFPT